MKRTLLAAALLVCCSVARADIIPSLFLIENLGAEDYRWSYNATVTENSRLENHGEFDQYFTIYDFNGYIAGSIFAPLGWTANTQLTGRDAETIGPPQLVTDDPNIVNLVFTWDGNGTVTGPETIGLFGARSRFGEQTTDAFEGQSTNNTGTTVDGDRLGNIGTVPVPVGDDVIVPEPGTMALLGPALLAAGLVRFRRAK